MVVKQFNSVQCRKRLVALLNLLPEVQALEVRGKRFGWFLDDHHGDRRLGLTLKAAREASQMLVSTEPRRFNVPNYIGQRGWLGFWLDFPPPDWSEIEKLVRDVYHLTVANRLSKR